MIRSLSPRARTWGAWGLLAALFVATQFAREIYYAIGTAVYRALFFRPLGAPLEWLEPRIGFEVYHASFWGKTLYTALIAALMAGTLWLFAHNRQERRLVFGLLGLALAVVVVANVMSKALHSHWLQTFSRDTLETLTSPFPVLFLIPVLILYRKTAFQR